MSQPEPIIETVARSLMDMPQATWDVLSEPVRLLYCGMAKRALGVLSTILDEESTDPRNPVVYWAGLKRAVYVMGGVGE